MKYFDITWLQIQYHIQRLSVVRNLFIQASQIELVLNVIFVDLQASKVRKFMIRT